MNETTCNKCNAQFQYEPVVIQGREYFQKGRLCPACQEKKDQAEKDRKRIEQEMLGLLAFERVCPVDYRAIVAEKLPMPELLELVLQWKFGPRGLLLHGQTGTGKSRCAYQLLKRECINGRKVMAVSAYELARYPTRIMHDQADDWLQECCHADLLLLDDSFKAKLSERTEEAIFVMIEDRTSNQLPIIATTNDTGESLAARISDDRAAPLIRRLREFCQVIHCIKP